MNRGFSSNAESPIAPETAARTGEAPMSAKRAPTDITPFFMILVAIGVIFPMVSRRKLDHGANDASRWNTVYFLVEHGTYEYLTDWWLPWNHGKGKKAEQITPEQREKWIHIGEKYYEPPYGIFAIAPFFTVDMVKIDGRYLSAKPTLLATCLAGVVLALQFFTGYTFAANPWFILRTTLILTQVLPFLAFLWVMRHHFNRQSASLFVRNFCIATAALATYLTPYLVTLNNHVVGAMAATFAIHAAIRVWYDGKRAWYWFALAGFFAAFAASVELFAVLLAAAIFVALLFKSPAKTLSVGLLAAMIPAGVAIGTNVVATGSIRPVQTRVDEKDGPYDYEYSYWRNPSGIDAQHEPKPIYLMHLLIGHHGWFLLTPIFLVSLVGMFAHWSRRAANPQPLLAAFVFLLWGAVLAYFVLKTGNYGGGCQGPRWLFWLIPGWLLMLPAGVEVLGRCPVGRFVCYLLVAVSLFSSAWAMPYVDDHERGTISPWSKSWAHELCQKNWMPEPFRVHY